MVRAYEELAEQLIGLERWASDLDVRAHRLFAGTHTPAQVHTIADEYAALADECDTTADACERAEPPRHLEHAERLRRMSANDRERSAYYRRRAAEVWPTTACVSDFVTLVPLQRHAREFG